MVAVSEIPSIEALRGSIPKGIADRKICELGRTELLPLQRHFQLGDTWGHPRLPKEWYSRAHPPSSFSCNLSVLLKSARDDNEYELAILTGTRILLTYLICPAKMSAGSAGIFEGLGFLAATTAITRLKRCLRILEKALAKPDNGAGLLSRLSYSDFTTTYLLTEIDRLRQLALLGYWDDVPHISREEVEKTNSNMGPAEQPPPANGTDVYLPLPDLFIHNAGRNTAWIIENLSPLLLDTLNDENLCDELTQDSGFCKTRKIRTKDRTSAIKSFSWPQLSSPIPFAQHLEQNLAISWPPRGWRECALFLRLVQCANFFILTLSAGPRAGEVLSFNSDCVVRSNGGTAVVNGITYKLIDRFDGEERDWPIPDLAVIAAQQQRRLTMFIERMHNPNFDPALSDFHRIPFWRALGHGRGFSLEPLGSNYNAELCWYAAAIDCSQFLDSQALTNHRFRKTLARIVAIALIKSPEMLADIFGYKKMDMTLSYILSDPMIVSDMRAAREALVQMMAKDALTNANDLGGPAAIGIQNAAKELSIRTMNDYGSETLTEIASALTYGGRTWLFVRDAVICTKGLDQSGPCAVGSVTANPAKCNEQCSHRLEMPAARTQAESAIKRCIEQIESADVQEDSVMIEAWEDKLRRNLGRFNDLADQWRENGTVARVLQRSANAY